MRSDAISAQAAEQRRHQRQESEVAPNAAQSAPAVRSVIQRVSSADAEEEAQQDRLAAAR